MHPIQSAIVVVGSLNVDMLFRVEHLPLPGETQTAATVISLPGGKGANQAVAAAKLGASTAMLGCVGKDDAGRMLLDALRESGVDTHCVIQCQETTGAATIFLTPARENSIVVAPGANAMLSATHIWQHRELLANAGIVLTQLETPLSILEELLTLTEVADVPVMLDPAPAGSLPKNLLHKITWFTPNETEAVFYLDGKATELASNDVEHLQTVCRSFQAMGPRNILLKLGSRGACVLTQSNEFYRVSAPPIDAVDTTGAGDTLNAAFAVALLRGDGVERALHYAVAAASFSVTRIGAMAGSPTTAELTTFYPAAAETTPDTSSNSTGQHKRT